MYKITEFASKETFMALLSSLDSYDDNGYLNIPFYDGYFNNIAGKDNYAFYRVDDGERLVALIPLEITYDNSLLHVTCYRFIGHMIFNYEGYISPESIVKDIHDTFREYLRSKKQAYVINYYDIIEDSAMYSALANDDCCHGGLSLYPCPYAKLDADFNKYFSKCFPSSKKRAEMRKFYKKLQAVGKTRLINITDEKLLKENRRYFDQTFRVHTERFADVYVKDSYSSENTREFYTRLIEDLMKEEKALLSMIVIDETLVSFILCLRTGDKLVDWIPAFDPAFAKYNLGNVHYMVLFEYLCQNGYKIFDYSKGTSVYKKKWAKYESHNRQFIMHVNGNPVSYLSFWRMLAMAKIKVYMRRKGLLGKIKRLMGSLYTGKTPVAYSSNKLHILTSERVVHENSVGFTYDDIVSFDINGRKDVLDALYQGVQITGVEKNDSGVTMYINRVS